jgi:serine/threonine-protein kinase RsbW
VAVFFGAPDLMDNELFAAVDNSSGLLVQFRVEAIMENVPLITRRIARVAKEAGFGAHALYQIELAVDEACANVVEHAYPGEKQGEMEVSCYLDTQAFVIRVRDWGTGFDPNSVEEPDVDAPLEDRGLGGLGLFLVRQVMDGVRFSFDPRRGSELLMSKKVEFAG